MSVATRRSLFALRLPPPPMTQRLVGAGAVAVIVAAWWFATSGIGSEERLISPVILPSPLEVIRSFPSLLKERALIESIAATLRRVLTGLMLAAAIGLPLGIPAGSSPVIEATGAPPALLRRKSPGAA